MRGHQLSLVIGAVLGAALVLLAFFAGNPNFGLIAHAECQIQGEVGNFTVWVPSTVVAAPFHGSESGSVTIWSRVPAGTVSFWMNTTATDGNVTAFVVGYENWSVYARSNVSVIGPGPNGACPSPFVAYFAPRAPQDLRHGGIGSWSVSTELESDVGLPIGLNGSQLCIEVENTSNLSCGAGAQFNLNYQDSSGIVNTCGSTQGQTIRDSSRGWPVSAPFRWNSRTYSVPLDPSGRNTANYANGTYAGYNYTFPANGGIWHYDNVAETSGTGAGLVFEYSQCPG